MAPHIVVRPFVPAAASAGEWRDYLAYINLRRGEDTPDLPPIADTDFQRNLCQEWPLFEHRYVLAIIAGRIVGSTSMSRRRTGTPDTAASSLKPGTPTWMMRLIRENRPGIARIVTHNAHVNAAMLAVNRRLGYVQYKDVRHFQISQEGILAALATRAARPA